MFWAINISGTPSPSRSPNRALRPVPNFGVAKDFQSLGCGFASRSIASSDWRRPMRSSIARLDSPETSTRKSWNRAGMLAVTPTLPRTSSLSTAVRMSFPSIDALMADPWFSTVSR
jgi:hypothetical protein